MYEVKYIYSLAPSCGPLGVSGPQFETPCILTISLAYITLQNNVDTHIQILQILQFF